MNKKEVTFRDPIVETVVDKFISRSDVGYKKYGITLDSDPQDIYVWLNHLQEELMDAVLYLQKAKTEITTLKEEAILDKIKNIEVKDAVAVRSKKKIATSGSHYTFTIDEED